MTLHDSPGAVALDAGSPAGVAVHVSAAPVVTLDQLADPSAPRSAPAPVPDGLDEFAQRWHHDGYLLLRDFVPPSLLDPLLPSARPGSPTAWALADLCCYAPLQLLLEYLVGEPVAAHLDTVERGPTCRGWVQEGVFQPDHLADRAASVWFALDDGACHGPLECVPGSHRLLPRVQARRVRAHLPAVVEQSPFWRIEAERLLEPLYDEAVARRGAAPLCFDGRRGDVLVAHPRLLHRVPPASDPTRQRSVLIAQYSAEARRPDLPPAGRHAGGAYFREA